MNPYLHDGNAFDLDAVFVDVTGVEWIHTGEWRDGEPLLRSFDHAQFHQDGPVPLPDVYHDHGPLMSRPGPVPAALRRAAIAGEVVAS